MAKGTRARQAYPTYWRSLKTTTAQDLSITINSVTDAEGNPREFILRSQNSGKLVEKFVNGRTNIFLSKKDAWPTGSILIKVKGSRHEGPVNVEYSWRTGKDAKKEEIMFAPSLRQWQVTV